MLSRHEALTLVLWMAGMLAVSRLLPILLMVRRLYGMDAQQAVFTRVDPSAVPTYLAGLLAAGGRALHGLGFEPLCCVSYNPIFGVSTARHWALLCWNDEQRTSALVNVATLPEPGWPLTYSFATTFANGATFSTINGLAWSIIGERGASIVNDPYSPTLIGQWRSHQANRDKLAAMHEPVTLSADELLQRSSELTREYIETQVAHSILVPAAPGKFRFTFVAAVRGTFRMRRGMRRYQQFLQERARESTPLDVGELPIDAEVDAYPATSAPPRSLSFANKAIIFAVTLALSAITLPLLGIDSVRWGVILVGVLIFHELGHWVAMKAFGYRDTSIFFLPLFGAATIGENKDATPTQRVLVYLAGPTPGFILGLALLGWMRVHPHAAPYWCAELGAFLAVLNALNLLPILPLDGGHIVNILLFSRHPWAEAIFRVVTIVALAVACILLHTPAIAVLPVILALGLRVLLMRARLAQELRRARRDGASDDRALLARAFQWFRERGYGALPYARRAAIVRLAMMEPPGFTSAATAGGLLALYLAIMALAPATYFTLRSRGLAAQSPRIGRLHPPPRSKVIPR